MMCRSLVWATVAGSAVAVSVPFALLRTRADDALDSVAENAAETELQEIMRIRQELEDLDPLKGTRFSKSAENAGAKSQRPADSTRHGDAHPFLRALRRVEASSRPSLENGGSPGNTEHPSDGAPADPDRRLIESLRHSARLLDGKAADLEDAGQYRKADRLRRLAGRLRRQARKLMPADVSETAWRCRLQHEQTEQLGPFGGVS